MVSRIDVIGQNGNDGQHYSGVKEGSFTTTLDGHKFVYVAGEWLEFVEVKNLNLEDLVVNIRNWAEDRNIIKGSNSKTQYVKLIEEAGELAGNIARGRDVKDDIGDMVVVLTILAAQHGLTIEECVAEAWDDIKDRKGRMVDGVFIKESDLG